MQDLPGCKVRISIFRIIFYFVLVGINFSFRERFRKIIRRDPTFEHSPSKLFKPLNQLKSDSHPLHKVFVDFWSKLVITLFLQQNRVKSWNLDSLTSVPKAINWPKEVYFWMTFGFSIIFVLSHKRYFYLQFLT